MLTSVLAIDDDKFIHQIIEKTLTEHNQVSHAYNGERALKWLATRSRISFYLM